MGRILSLLFFFVCASVLAIMPVTPQRHVVVVVWDGMRPDFVTEQNTPTLWQLARQGVTFRNHHAVYPSATMVNGTAMVTGVYPGGNGITANHAYLPDINPHHAIDVELASSVEKGDEISGGKYISVPTLAELLSKPGARSIVAAAKTVGLLLDRQFGVDRGGASLDRVTLFKGQCLPASLSPKLAEALGPFPSAHLQDDVWTTKALTEVLWKEGVPVLTILWLGEPDLTQHQTAPGSPAALAAIKSSDDNLAAALLALDDRKVRGTTDVFVVSDHGFSTIRRSVDLRKILNQAGFAATTEFKDQPKPGEIMLAGNGGSVLFYVTGHDAAVTHRLVEFLQQSDFAGVIFTKQGIEGTFSLEQAKIENSRAPDVVMAFHWYDSKNQFDVPGMIDADWQRPAGQGTHVTLSRFDMHNTLIAAGPDFKHDEKDDLATGNIDLAATILQILKIKPPSKMNGRILTEAMTGRDDPRHPSGQTNTIEATKQFPSGTWRQSLQISRIGSTVYLDQGNGAFAPKQETSARSQ